MALYILTSSDVGAPTLNGVNGSMCNVLDWAFGIAGVATEYTGTNSRIYRWAHGNRFRLHVYHDSAVTGNAGRVLVRGCENASNSTTLIDPFPLVSQVADNASLWLASTTANATARDYRILIDDGATSGLGWIHMWVNAGGIADNWSWSFFGDYYPRYSSDTFNTLIVVQNTTSPSTANSMQSLGSTSISGIQKIASCRSIDGSVKSSLGAFNIASGGFGGVAGATPALGGYNSAIYRERVGVTDAASTTTTAGSNALMRRGWIPNLWNPIHSSTRTGVASLDTFTDTEYNAGSLFRVMATGSSQSWHIYEETDTYYPPSD